MKTSIHVLSTALLLFSASASVFSQQDPYITHYAFNRMMYNPAAAGERNKYCISAMSHYQYLGYEDMTPELNSPYSSATQNVGPKTSMFSASAPVTNYAGLGIGFIRDRLGYESSQHVKIDAAGRMPFLNGAELAIGIEVNILQKGLDGTKLKPLAPLDPSIPSVFVSDRNVVFGSGMYYTNPMINNANWKNLWIGVSALNLNKAEYTFMNDKGNSIVYSETQKHYYAMGGISKLNFLGLPVLAFQPSFMLKYNTVLQLDATALVEFKEKLSGGLAYRSTSDALSVLLGYSGFRGVFRGLRVGYSYDFTLSKINLVSSGTHELQINYCFSQRKILNLVTPPTMHRESD